MEGVRRDQLLNARRLQEGQQGSFPGLRLCEVSGGVVEWEGHYQCGGGGVVVPLVPSQHDVGVGRRPNGASTLIQYDIVRTPRHPVSDVGVGQVTVEGWGRVGGLSAVEPFEGALHCAALAWDGSVAEDVEADIAQCPIGIGEGDLQTAHGGGKVGEEEEGGRGEDGGGWVVGLCDDELFSAVEGAECGVEVEFVFEHLRGGGDPEVDGVGLEVGREEAEAREAGEEEGDGDDQEGVGGDECGVASEGSGRGDGEIGQGGGGGDEGGWVVGEGGEVCADVSVHEVGDGEDHQRGDEQQKGEVDGVKVRLERADHPRLIGDGHLLSCVHPHPQQAHPVHHQHRPGQRRHGPQEQPQVQGGQVSGVAGGFRDDGREE